jgi:hypothetical protein
MGLKWSKKEKKRSSVGPTSGDVHFEGSSNHKRGRRSSQTISGWEIPKYNVNARKERLIHERRTSGVVHNCRVPEILDSVIENNRNRRCSDRVRSDLKLDLRDEANGMLVADSEESALDARVRFNRTYAGGSW